MAKITLYKKNRIHIDSTVPVITVTDAIAFDTGQSIVNFIRDGSNNTAWVTTDSTDAANTQLDVDMTDERDIDRIIMMHNFEDFTIQYWNGVSFVDFSNIINQAGVAVGTQYFSFDQVTTSRIRLIITKCQGGADIDKKLRQFILTEDIGILVGEPNISKLRINKVRRNTRMVSGKFNRVKRSGATEATLELMPTTNANDVSLFQTIFDSDDGILFSFIGGDETGHLDLQGFRLEDVYLMGALNDLDSAYNEGFFTHGKGFVLELGEVDG